jgi:hypothetical protein
LVVRRLALSHSHPLEAISTVAAKGAKSFLIFGSLQVLLGLTLTPARAFRCSRKWNRARQRNASPVCVASLEEATAQFQKSWDEWKAWAELEDVG